METHDQQQRPLSPEENTQQTVYQGDPNVHPAGYRRDEQMAERKDNLAQQAEQLNEAGNVHNIDPAKMQPVREIQHAISLDALTVSNKLPDYEYKWVRDVNPMNGGPSVQVLRAISKTITYNGVAYPTWEVVRYDKAKGHPEAIERRMADGTRRIGDCVLLRCHKNTKALLDQEERDKVIRQEQGVTAVLEEMGRQTPAISYAGSQVGEAAKSIARGTFIDQVRSGNVAGMPLQR